MRHRNLAVAVIAAALAGPTLAAASPRPTPSPTPAAKKRKLSGGSFGVPPAPTPAAGGSAESLANAARKAQDESTATGPSATRKIVITNETLGKQEPTPGGTSITITGGAGSKPVVKVPPTPAPAQIDDAVTTYRDAAGRTEKDWRDRAAALREGVLSAQSALDGANEEARRLENDFYAWSDGNYRERVIRPAWDQAKERAKALAEELERAKSAVSDLEEEARKSGTPPGWLR